MRQIIILSNTLNNDATMNLKYVYWIATPSGQKKPDNSISSLVSDATPQELNALRTGQVQEIVLSANIPVFWGSSTIQQYLTERYAIQQNYNINIGALKDYSGASFDGTVWSNLPA